MSNQDPNQTAKQIKDKESKNLESIFGGIIVIAVGLLTIYGVYWITSAVVFFIWDNVWVILGTLFSLLLLVGVLSVYFGGKSLHPYRSSRVVRPDLGPDRVRGKGQEGDLSPE